MPIKLCQKQRLRPKRRWSRRCVPCLTYAESRCGKHGVRVHVEVNKSRCLLDDGHTGNAVFRQFEIRSVQYTLMIYWNVNFENIDAYVIWAIFAIFPGCNSCHRRRTCIGSKRKIRKFRSSYCFFPCFSAFPWKPRLIYANYFENWHQLYFSTPFEIATHACNCVIQEKYCIPSRMPLIIVDMMKKSF